MSRALAILFALAAFAGQVPGSAAAPNIPVSSCDRVYAAEQFSNKVSVNGPASNKLLGVIRLDGPQPANLSPLYRGQLLVHGLGFSPTTARSCWSRLAPTRWASSTRKPTR